MSGRRLYLDRGPGETRGVVVLDGRPERLLISRPDDVQADRLGARSIAVARRIDRAAASVFMDLGGVVEAVLAQTGPAAGLAEGAVIEVEVAAESRRGKSPVVRLIGRGEGPPRLVAAAAPIADQLRAFAADQKIIEGLDARLVADEAQSEALAIEHALPGGGSLAIEPTRALVAVDVDLGAGTGDPRRAARRVNLAAIANAARLLRLKALGGMIAIDLVGKGHDGEALSAAAKAAFAADEPGVSIGAINRFGLMVLVKPWRRRPLHETLCGAHDGVSPKTTGFAVLRALEREAWSDRGARLIGRCSPAAAETAHAYINELSDRLGARFVIEPDAGLAADAFEIRIA